MPKTLDAALPPSGPSCIYDTEPVLMILIAVVLLAVIILTVGLARYFGDKQKNAAAAEKDTQAENKSV